MRITDISIRGLQAPERGAKIYYDDTISGFGVRVSEGGTKSFVLTHGKLRRRQTLGRVGVLTLQQAREKARKELAAYTLGKTEFESITWKDGLALFLKDGRKRLKARTLQDYERYLTVHFRFGDLKLSEITAQEIQRRIDRLSETPTEQRNTFTVLRTFMRWAHRKYYIDTNPMERMVSGFKYRPRTRVLTDNELVRVWNAAGDDTFGIIVKLLILTGQRVGEIMRLSKEMIGKDSVTLPATLTKNGREHIFPVGPATLELLKAVPFTALPNRHRSKEKLDERSGVSGWTLHDLRRTFASGLASQSVPIAVVEKFLNHVSGSFGGIVGVYQRYDFAPEMREAMAIWERHLQTLLKS